MIRRILVAVDGSVFAARAAETAMELARQVGGEVAFLTAVNPRSAPTGICDDEEAWPEMLMAEAHEFLSTLAARADVKPVPLTFVERGDPAARIAEAARAWRADLIVMGTHGRTALENVLLGSVAQAVLRHAPCPVMVVRGG